MVSTDQIVVIHKIGERIYMAMRGGIMKEASIEQVLAALGVA